MRKSGKLKQNNNYYTGSVTIPKLNGVGLMPLKIGVELEPMNNDGVAVNAPSHIINMANSDVEIGNAWTKTSKKDGSAFLSLTLDIPEFDSPVYLSAFPNAQVVGEWNVLWSRAKKEPTKAVEANTTV